MRRLTVNQSAYKSVVSLRHKQFFFALKIYYYVTVINVLFTKPVVAQKLTLFLLIQFNSTLRNSAQNKMDKTGSIEANEGKLRF